MANEIQSFLSVSNVVVGLDAGCKREVLRQLSVRAAASFGLDSEALLDSLYEREQLGTTGIGEGVAVPHARADLSQLQGFFAQLVRPVDFDAVDDRPVDLVFMLLAPHQADADHLKALSKIARLVRDPEVRAAMRGARDAESLFAVVVGDAAAKAA